MKNLKSPAERRGNRRGSWGPAQTEAPVTRGLNHRDLGGGDGGTGHVAAGGRPGRGPQGTTRSATGVLKATCPPRVPDKNLPEF